MPVYQLDEGLWFPNPKYGESDGLLAVGGDLSVNRLLLAYSHGIFPWYAYQLYDEPHWYCPMDRFVIFPKEIHISHSMKQLMRQGKYHITTNQDFKGVINACSKADSRNTDMGAWLGPQMIRAYTKLHKMGIAHSVEVWEVEGREIGKRKTENYASTPSTYGDSTLSQGEKGTENGVHNSHRLVGGLYGIDLNGAFFGESMFSLVPSASKLALIHLAQHLEKKGYSFIDCQFETPHLLSMGGRHITYEEYMSILNANAHKKE
ncbi:MAG: leucyl/phenylalanyl-tRNA--protein transferase [Bacteroidaceae bacterium]|nr:leucyl/phenylalanyl-tRNA--protein transferase [Bacteroidaceae bacterium]